MEAVINLTALFKEGTRLLVFKNTLAPCDQLTPTFLPNLIQISIKPLQIPPTKLMPLINLMFLLIPTVVN